MINFSGRALHAFLVLEECLQFTVAAKRCNVSQSAFSQTIAKLEQQAGARLFDRSTRQVALTAEGKLFSISARQLAFDIDAAFKNIGEHAAQRRGKVALAAPPSHLSEWLPAIIATYRREHPGVQVSVFDTYSDRCLSLVREGSADFALNAQQGNDREFESTLLFHENFYLVCRQDHPLAARKRLNVADLAQVDFIHTVRSGSVWQQLMPVLRTVPIRDTGIEVEHFTTLAGLIVHGFGVSVMPQFSLPTFHNAGLVSIRLRDAGLKRPVYLVWARGRSLSIAAQTLIGMIKRQKPV
jgi:DNA-binding transcriptional LysR family regulator